MKSESFWDRSAPKYAKKPIADMAAYEEKLASIRSFAHSTDHVLEIGCGTGGTALKIAPSVAHVTATDISEAMIKIARSKLGDTTDSHVSFHQAGASQLVQGHPFDMICAFSLLHLVEDLPHVLGRVFEQLKPGGVFLSKTVCLKDRPLVLQAIVRTLTLFGLAPKVTTLSREGFIAHLGDAGFEIEQSKYFGTGRMSPFIVARKPAD